MPRILAAMLAAVSVIPPTGANTPPAPSGAVAPVEVAPVVVTATKPVEVAPVVVTARKPTPVSEVDVEGRLRCTRKRPQDVRATTPYVVDSYPREGDVVRPGLLLMRVTYSEPMAPCSVLLGADRDYYSPQLVNFPALLLPDFQTFYFAVRVQPDRYYGQWFNPPGFPRFFRNSYGALAKPYFMVFKTSKAAPATTDREALEGDPQSTKPMTPPGRALVLGMIQTTSHPVCRECDAAYSILDLPNQNRILAIRFSHPEAGGGARPSADGRPLAAPAATSP